MRVRVCVAIDTVSPKSARFNIITATKIVTSTLVHRQKKEEIDHCQWFILVFAVVVVFERVILTQSGIRWKRNTVPV